MWHCRDAIAKLHWSYFLHPAYLVTTINTMRQCTLFYLSLFSWTGNRPPRITSPLILAPLGARLSTDTRCFTITFLLCKNHETFAGNLPDHLEIIFKGAVIVLHIFLKKCKSTRQWFCSSDLFFSCFKCCQQRSFQEIKNLSGTFCTLSSSNFNRLGIHFDGSL